MAEGKLLEVKKEMGVVMSEIFAGVGFGITVLLLFALLWIPVLKVLLLEFNWLFR